MKNARSSYIFEFNDGKKERKVDAWKVLIQFQTKLGATPTMLTDFASDPEGMVKFVEIARDLLKLPEWSEDEPDNLSDGEVMELFAQLMESTSTQKKITKSKRTLQSSTELAS